jgi:hypothetical protein
VQVGVAAEDTVERRKTASVNALAKRWATHGRPRVNPGAGVGAAGGDIRKLYRWREGGEVLAAGAAEGGGGAKAPRKRGAGKQKQPKEQKRGKKQKK